VLSDPGPVDSALSRIAPVEGSSAVEGRTIPFPA
jgi:hypothetical protein